MRTRTKNLVLALCVTIAGLALGPSAAMSTARAQATPMPTALAAPSTPASHRAAAEALLRRVVTQETAQGTVTAMVDAMLQNMPALAPHRGAMMEFFARHFTVDELVRRTLPAYVAAMSELELRQMAWFFGTPAGARYLAATPALTAAGAQAGMAIVQEHAAELQQLIESRAGAPPR